MKKENSLFILIVCTVLVIRLSVFLVPNIDIHVGDINIHHFWFGIILILISLLVSKRSPKFWLWGIGIGLAIDQLFFMLLGAGTDTEYWAGASVYGAIICLIIVFILRKKFS